MLIMLPLDGSETFVFFFDLLCSSRSGMKAKLPFVIKLQYIVQRLKFILLQQLISRIGRQWPLLFSSV
jgi:hypothetical protein